MGRMWPLCMLAVCALSIGTGLQAVDQPALRAIDRPLENVRIVDMRGTVWTAERFRGRVTLVEFWATWCAPCLADLPVLKKARARYSRDDFEILGVSFDVIDRRTFVSWINRQGVTWPQAFDGRGRHGEAARQLRVVAVPTSFLVDRQGQVVAMNLRGDRLLAAIERFIAERPAGAATSP